MANNLETLLDLENAGWAALCDGTAAQFYGATMTPEAIMVLANGTAMDRNAVTGALSQAPPWRAYRIEDPRLILVDADNAALVYTGIAYRDAEEPAFTGAMSTVYHRTDDGWRIVLYQQTPIPD